MARRQEQESADSEVTEVAPNLLRLQLPISMPGLGHVNCYAIVDADGAAIVDPGLPGPASWRALQDRLRQAGLQIKDIHTVIVTHSHPDHFGGAARFAKEAGSKVVAHRSFGIGSWSSASQSEVEVSIDDLAAQKATVEADADENGEAERPTRHSFRGWDGPTPWGGKGPRPPFRSRMRYRWMRMRGGSSGFLPEITEPVDHESVLLLGGREWFVLHTPGHTADHFCLHDPETGIFLAGDHVLPTITPHISGLTHVRDPLKLFFYSLDRVGEIQDVKQVLPAHGHPFNDLRGRTQAIKRHHFERLERIKEISNELGPASVEAISQKLFKPRSWGPMADSETFAHLEHLRLTGDAERHEDKQGLLIYETG
jgi:glyoxylase-like metal-dependent hydrolase (beta-lactamase superfamily II)